MAPSVEKPTAMTASSAHCAKRGMPGRASRLMTNKSSPAVASVKETAHMYHDSQTASLGLLLPLSRPGSKRSVLFSCTGLHATSIAQVMHPPRSIQRSAWRNCLEIRDGLRNRGSGGRKEGPKKTRSGAFLRLRSTLARPRAIFQTVSEGVFSELRLYLVLGRSLHASNPKVAESVFWWACKIADVHEKERTEGGAVDIEVLERAIKTSLEEALKRMRDADDALTKAQQAGRSDRNIKLAEALEEYNGCVAELTYYLKASSRQRDTDPE